MLGMTLLLGLVASCAPEQARYVLREDPAITARFLIVDTTPDWPSGLALRLHSTRTGRDYDFLPWHGGSDGRLKLASTTDVTAPQWHTPDPDGGPRPIGDVEYIGANADYRLLSDGPRRAEPAPAHFLLPDLREALWYRAAPDRRESTARQFFDLTDCKP